VLARHDHTVEVEGVTVAELGRSFVLGHVARCLVVAHQAVAPHIAPVEDAIGGNVDRTLGPGAPVSQMV